MKIFFHILLGFVFTVLFSCSEGKVDVVISNASGNTVNNVRLDWEGEAVMVGPLTHGATSKRVIHPHIESPLTLRYHRDRQFACRNAAYFDRDWRGVIQVHLRPDDSAEFSWTDQNSQGSAVIVGCTQEDL